MSTSNLVILGGGEDQLPAYVEGRRLGYRIIGVDQRPDALGARYADEFLCVTTREPDAIAAELGDKVVAAVLSPASDVAQSSVAALNERYRGVGQPSPAAVRASQDKSFFHSVVAELGFPVYAFAQSDSADELMEAAGRISFPMVVKPTDASGSKGLSCVESVDALPEAIEQARKHSFTGEVIIEEFVEGQHFSVERFSQDGAAALTVVTERGLTAMPHMISMSHLVPAALDPVVEQRLASMVDAILAHIDHHSGPVNLDFILTPDGRIYFIEMGARLGGNGMPMLVQQALGVNTVQAAIKLAVGESPELDGHERQQFVMLRILASEQDGLLTAVTGLEETRELDGITDVRLFKQPGDHVRQYTQAAHKLGYLLASADSRHELLARVDRALQTLKFEIDPHPSETNE